MNCPTCGAHNESDAQFCAECGTPLQSAEIDTPISGEIIDMPTEPDNDATILSGADELAAQIRAATAESEVAEAGAPDTSEPVSAPEPPAETPPPPRSQPEIPAVEPPPLPTGDAPAGVPPAAGGSNRKLMIIGGVVLAVALLCCCCSLLVGSAIGSDPEVIEDILREISSLPVILPLV